MNELNLEIVTPAKSVFNGTVKSITVPGSVGSFQVLKNHAPILSTIDIGKIKVELQDGSDKFYASGGGTIEVNNNKILLLADSLEAADEIDVKRAEAAKERAEKRLKDKNGIDVVRAEIALSKAVNRLNIAKNHGKIN